TSTGWSYSVLYSFCSQTSQTGCTGGAGPAAGLIMDGAGNLYGTTQNGGSLGYGTVFQLAPNGPGWTQSVLYSFCSQTGCIDGYAPSAGLIMDGAGNLYGTTVYGGRQNRGTAYRLAPTGHGRH